MEKVLSTLQKFAETYPTGFTVSLTNLTLVKSGWVVAKKETQNCFGLQGLKKAYEVAIKTSKTLGGWQDGELFYWDCVMVFHDEQQSTQAGIENEQRAIYHLDTGRLKWL